MVSIGDMAQALVLRQKQTSLRQTLDQRAVEISTGLVHDAPTHLKGDVTTLMALDRSLSRIETFRVATSEAALVTGAMQTALGQIQERTQGLSQVLISADLVKTPGMYKTLATEASEGLSSLIAELNASVAGRFAFSGIATDRPPLTDAGTLMASIRPLVASETTLQGIETQLSLWFDTPAGGFETVTYQGADEPLSPIRLSQSETAIVDIRADEAVFRQLMKSAVLAALATDPAMSLSIPVQSEMLSKAGRDMQGAQEALVELRSGLGAIEARVEEATTRNAAERTALNIARLDLVGVDEYEAATAYQNAQAQLESLYAITARSAQLSLTSFLK